MLTNKANWISIFLHLLLFLIVASSVLTYGQVTQYALNGNWHPEYYKLQSYISMVSTPVKLLKDGFSFLLLAGSLFFHPTNPDRELKKNNLLAISYMFWLCLLGIGIARSIASDLSISLILFSLRPIIIVIALFVFCHRHLNAFYLRWVLEAVNFLALVQIVYAFLQRSTAVKLNGVNWLSSGLVRSVGTFIEPNSMGLFLALCFYCNLSLLPFHRWRYFILGSLASAIYLSDSRTSLLIIGLILTEKLYQASSRSYKILKDSLVIKFIGFPLFLLTALFMLGQINQLSFRAASSSMYGGRLEIFINYINQTEPISLLFGRYISFGSNILQTLQKNNAIVGAGDGDYFLADSTWASLLSQFGILGIYLALQVMSCIWKTPLSCSSFSGDNCFDISHKPGFLIYGLFSSFTIILFEYYAVLPIFICLLFVLRTPKSSLKTTYISEIPIK